jgi:outer membrane protein
LPQLIDVALRNNPRTRIAWLQAREAEANLGSSRSAYLPEVDVNANLTVAKSGNRTPAVQTVFGPSLALNYLLFDFGGREALVEEARQSLIAADYLHNAAIQDVVLQVEQIYYGYLADKALADAYGATLKELKANLDAAEARHSAGVATIADVLQARTAMSQGQLNYDTIEGALQTTIGALASALGLPPSTGLDVGVLPLEVPADEVAGAVDVLLAQAQTQRPELAAARADALAAQSRVRQVRAAGMPSLSLAGNAGHTFALGNGSNADSWSAGLLFRFPLFTGFRNTWDIRAAEAQEQIARERVASVGQQVDLQAWTSYYDLRTAAARMKTSRDLLSSAQESVDVARGRYKAGVGNILDLLTAQAALENARAQEVQARADWFLAVAQLAHDTGGLGGAETGAARP